MKTGNKILLITSAIIFCVLAVFAVFLFRDCGRTYSKRNFVYRDSPAARQYHDAKSMEEIDMNVVMGKSLLLLLDTIFLIRIMLNSLPILPTIKWLRERNQKRSQ